MKSFVIHYERFERTHCIFLVEEVDLLLIKREKKYNAIDSKILKNDKKMTVYLALIWKTAKYCKFYV